MTGFLTPEQRRYNVALSMRRTDIERAFGVLKCRFRRLLLGIDMVDLSEIDEVILASCVLHNICMLYDDETDFVEDDYDDFERNQMANIDDNDIIPDQAAQRVEGRIKRITITNNL
jgi:hypothetical protein